MCYENDFVYAYLSYWGYKAGLNVMKGFWEEMKAMGAEPNPYHAGFLQAVGVAESRAEALDLYAEPASYFYNRCLHLDPKFARPPGYISEATVRSRITSQVSRAADQAIAARPFFSKDDNVLEEGPRHHRQPRRGRRPAPRSGHQPQCRPPDAAAPFRQHVEGPDEA